MLRRSQAILARQKVASEDFNVCACGPAIAQGFDAFQFTRGSGETSQVPKSRLQQTLYQFGANETGRPCDQNKVIATDYEIVEFHISHLLCDVRLGYGIDAHDRKELAEMIKKFD